MYTKSRLKFNLSRQKERKIIFSYTNNIPLHSHTFRQNNILKLYKLYVLYSLRFILIVVLDFATQINKTFNFVYLLDKNIITNTSNQISTNRKIEHNKKSINSAS